MRGVLGRSVCRRWPRSPGSAGSLRRDKPGARSGWAHNDLNPGWFADPEPGPDDVRLKGEGGVDYFTGRAPEGVRTRRTVRAVSLLFYLGNPDWSAGDGGETALYETISSREPGSSSSPASIRAASSGA